MGGMAKNPSRRIAFNGFLGVKALILALLSTLLLAGTAHASGTAASEAPGAASPEPVALTAETPPKAASPEPAEVPVAATPEPAPVPAETPEVVSAQPLPAETPKPVSPQPLPAEAPQAASSPEPAPTP